MRFHVPSFTRFKDMKDDHLIHGSFGLPQSTTRSVQPYYRAHERDQQTYNQTTLLRLPESNYCFDAA